MSVDLAASDALLSTTRAVRKRLDFSRPVPREVITDCIRLAQQAPTASNSQTWRWIVVDDAGLRAKIADLYCEAEARKMTINRMMRRPQENIRAVDVYIMYVLVDRIAGYAHELR